MLTLFLAPLVSTPYGPGRTIKIAKHAHALSRTAYGCVMLDDIGDYALAYLDTTAPLADLENDSDCLVLASGARATAFDASMPSVAPAATWLERRGIPGDFLAEIPSGATARQAAWVIAGFGCVAQRLGYQVGKTLREALVTRGSGESDPDRITNALDTLWEDAPTALKDELIGAREAYADMPRGDYNALFAGLPLRRVLREAAFRFEQTYCGISLEVPPAAALQRMFAYGDSRSEVWSDAFSGSFAGYENGQGGYQAFTGPSGGVAGTTPSFAADSSLRRSTGTFSNDQYARATIGGVGSGNPFCGCAVRAQTGTNLARYCGLFHNGAYIDEYSAAYFDASASITAIATATSAQVPQANDVVTVEAEGTTIRMGTDEGAGDTQRVTGTHATLSSGWPAVHWYNDNQSGHSCTAFSAGDIGGTVELVVADALHGHAAGNVGLVQASTLAVDDALHGHSSDNLALTQASTLVVAEALHSHSTDAIELTIAFSLLPADATHGHTADGLELVQANVLVVADAGHAHTADGIVLVQANLLALQDALHAHSADNLALTQANLLAVADALHAHAAETPTPVVEGVLPVQSALHAHTADAVALVQANQLAVAEAVHGHAADNITLVQGGLLLVADALHAHGVDNVVLTQASVLVLADALHDHSAANIVLEQHSVLSVAGSVHGHTAGSVTLTEAALLAPAAAVHVHTADSLELTQSHLLVVSDALHDHFAGLLSLRLPGFVGEPGRIEKVAAARRIFTVEAQGRTFVVTKGKRTLNS